MSNIIEEKNLLIKELNNLKEDALKEIDEQINSQL